MFMYICTCTYVCIYLHVTWGLVLLANNGFEDVPRLRKPSISESKGN